MLKKFFYILIILFFITNAYSIGTKEKGDHASGKDGDWSRKGPPPASKYRLGYKEFERAAKLDKKGKRKKAKLKYEKALNFLLESNAENGSNPDTLYYLGLVSAKLGKYENAEIYYLLGLEVEPKHINIYKDLGILYLDTDRKNKAIEKLEILKSCNCKEYNDLKELIEKK
tara:strand:+ start:1383 stop:1895 length:513 start_codon:yes stop_codon:yes gene_type:complete